MKIKNLEIKKVIKTTAIALVTGTMLATSSVGVMPTKVEASSYTQNNDVMYYFTNNLQNNVDKYLEKTASSTNLTKLLEYYDTLYDYVNGGKYVRNTYYRNLAYYEQDELNYMLTNWGNEIYDLYSKKSYFKTTCKNKLGFSLTYDSQETGYDKDHEKTMEYYTETLDENVDNYLSKSNSQTTLKNALDTYKKLINFIKGSSRSYGYIFSELTLTEQAELVNLLEDWTYDIETEYGNYGYYSSSCISKVGWTVNISNLYKELGEYIGNNNGYIPNNPIYPNVPNNPTTPGTQIPTVPTVPSVPNVPSVPEQVPAVPIVPSVPSTPVQTVPGNNTIGKDWRSNYIDPSINTSRGERDWTPENIDEFYYTEDYYYRYTQDPRGYYYQTGYYDAYGNFIPYNNGTNYNQYNNYDGYVEDYVPTYIPR